MTPREYVELNEKEKERQADLASNWHHPLSKGSNILQKVLRGMQEFKLAQEDVPLIIKLIDDVAVAPAIVTFSFCFVAVTAVFANLAAVTW